VQKPTTEDDIGKNTLNWQINESLVWTDLNVKNYEVAPI
jgi:hypothetical protein